MPEPPAEVRRINWPEVFAFTQILRTFRMAIHPSKLGLALAGVLLTVLLGWVLDLIWRERHQPMPGEVDAFWRVPDINAWREAARERQFLGLAGAWAEIHQAPPPDDLRQRYQRSPGDVVSSALGSLRARHRTLVAQAVGPAERAQIAGRHNTLHAEIVSARPRGVFASYVEFQLLTTRQAIEAGVSLNWFRGLREALLARGVPFEPPVARRDLGALACVVLIFRADQWMIMEHPLFALLFWLGTLAIWALVGGALCRMAALNVARDERLSPRAAITFGQRKFLAFFFAPLLPIALIAVILLVLAVGGLITAIPGAGEIIGGLGVGLALVGGFVATLVVIGLVAGGSLFYPTIAVEGSDSFDAMSRSYSYIYSRPWRAALYGAVAFIYGGICFLFARFFLLLMLKGTRFGMNIGLQPTTHRPETGTVGAGKLDAMWASPTWEDLWRSVPPFGQQAAEPVGAFLIGIWLLLAVGLLWAFLISFYFSASTIIYFLLRREVDATDLEDVYLEEDEDLETAPPPPPPPPPPGAGETAQATPPPGEALRSAEPHVPPPRTEAAQPPTPTPPPPPQEPPPPAPGGGGG